MKDMAADTPCNTEARMIWVSCWVGLVLYAGLVQVVSADCAGVCADGPGPHSHSIPLLDLEALGGLALALLFTDGLLVWLFLDVQVHRFWLCHVGLCTKAASMSSFKIPGRSAPFDKEEVWQNSASLETASTLFEEVVTIQGKSQPLQAGGEPRSGEQKRSTLGTTKADLWEMKGV